MNPDIIIRKAEKNDMDEVAEMIKELANYENMSNGPKIDSETLQRDGFLRSNPLFMCNVVESNNKLLGYAIFYFFYSTWEGISMFLEDIYIKPDFRNLGIGKKLFTSVIKVAKDNNCSRLEFNVLKWNPAKKFYQSLGAVNATETEQWQVFKIKNSHFDVILTNNVH